MPNTEARGYTLDMLGEAEEGAVWYDHKQGMVAVQWGNVVRYMEPAEWRCFVALVGKASAKELPCAPMIGRIVPLPLRGGR